MSIKTSRIDAAYWITFNNQSKRNAITKEMYAQLCTALDEADADETTLLTVFTGEGDYYCSGNQFSPSDSGVVDLSELAHDAGYSQFVIKIIEHRKILVGLVNGPAFGIAATTLSLLDYVVCSDLAYFGTPFAYIGVGPEGAASVAFERVMGTSKASEMVLFGEALSSAEALKRGFVSHVFPNAEFREKAAALVLKYSKLPRHSVLASKELMRGDKFRKEMLAVHDKETRLIKKLFLDDRTIALIRSKFTRAKM